MIRARTYEAYLGGSLTTDRILVLVEDWPDGSQTMALKFPDVFDGAVWGRKFSPVRDETSGEPTTVQFSNYIEAAAQLQAREDIEDRRRGA